MQAIADKYYVSIAQLGIRYLLELDLLPLPKTANPAHMKSNADVGFKISQNDMELLNQIQPIRDDGSASHLPVFTNK